MKGIIIALLLAASWPADAPQQAPAGPSRFQILPVELSSPKGVQKTLVRWDTTTGDAWLYQRSDIETPALKAQGIPYMTADGWLPIPPSYSRSMTNVLQRLMP